MSNYSFGSLKVSGSIIWICASLAIAPIAQARTSISKASGTTSYANGFVYESDRNAGQDAGSKSNETASTNTLTANRAAQNFSSLLERTQFNYNYATAIVNQLSSASTSTPSTIATKPAPVRFAIKSEALTNCGCTNPDVVSDPLPRNNSVELSAAKAAQAKAALELAQAQAQARQFLAANQANSTAISAGNNAFIPLW